MNHTRNETLPSLTGSKNKYQQYTQIHNSAMGKTQADQYTLQLRERTQWLADNPMLGRARDEIKEGYRSFSEGNHVIFYRMAGSAIEIIGIPHQNMDIEQNLT